MQRIIFAAKFLFMFNRYWRSYPWYMQMLQFIILMAVMLSFVSLALSPLIMNLTKVSPDQIINISEKSPRTVINAGLLLQFVSSIGIFLLPALLFAYFTHPKPGKYLGLVKPGNPTQLILSVIIIISAMPLIASIAEWLMQFDLSGSAKEMQERNDRMVKAFTSSESIIQLVFSFIVVAIIPGVGEELFFRGLLMRFAAKRSSNIYFPLVLSSLMFALMHDNIYGMLSIFIAGLILGSFYYLTGSLWSNILAHVCFNGFQVVLVYFSKDAAVTKAMEQNSVPIPFVIGSTLICIGAFYFLWKMRTPLPDDWSADYSKQELLEESTS